MTTMYGQAVINSQVVATMLAYFIRQLQNYIKLNLDDIHIIGHSLGAQIAGLAAKEFTNPMIGRITGKKSNF